MASRLSKLRENLGRGVESITSKQGIQALSRRLDQANKDNLLGVIGSVTGVLTVSSIAWNGTNCIVPAIVLVCAALGVKNLYDNQIVGISDSGQPVTRKKYNQLMNTIVGYYEDSGRPITYKEYMQYLAANRKLKQTSRKLREQLYREDPDSRKYL